MRANNIFWGVVIVVAGVLLLLNTLGILRVNMWVYFWPVLLIIAGVWLLLGPRLIRANAEIQTLSIPLSDAREGEIRLSHGAGRLEIRSLDVTNLNLMEGTFSGGVEKEEQRQAAGVRLRLKPSFDFIFPPFINPQGLSWNIKLSPIPDLRLRLDGGASDTDLDLSALKVKDLRLETGASATRIILPANAGYTNVDVDCGAASVEIKIPEGVAAKINIDSGLSGIDIDEHRFQKIGNSYMSPDYETAANRVEIKMDVGVGSVKVY